MSVRAGTPERVGTLRAAVSERRGPEPRLSRSKSAPSREPQRRSAGEGEGPSLSRGAFSVLQRQDLCTGPFLWPGPPPTSPLLERRARLSRRAQAGPARGARTPCRRRCARAAGTKTPLPAPAPAPARSAGRVKGWAPCGEPGHGAVRRLGAPGRCLCNAGTGRSPLVRTWQLSPGIGASVGGSARWVGHDRWDPQAADLGRKCRF